MASSLLIFATKIAARSTTKAPTTTAPPFYVPLPPTQTRESTSVIIDLQPGQFPYLLCWYPISGNYCTLPRVLFYITIIAALVLRHYPWLRVGALAASLTYSGAAAIHGCLLIWSGHASGELDVLPLVAILSGSCLLMVPLLTWSSTIRHAGKPQEEKRHQKEKLERLLARLNEQEEKKNFRTDAEESAIRETFNRRRRRLDDRIRRRGNRSDAVAVASRTILIMWACLVTTGFLCTFVGIVDQTPDMRYGHFEPWDFSQATEIRCVPDNGTLDLSTGQNAYDWGQFFVTSELISTNNCLDPCPNFPTKDGPIWFRSYSDLQSLEEMQLFNIIGSSRKLDFIQTYAYKWSWICVYVLIQGIWAVCLGRSQPSEARVLIYGLTLRLLAKEKAQPRTWITGLAKTIAFVAYLGAVSIAIISLPLLVLNVTLIELYIQQLPQSETPKHVGAWNPYASVGLALLSFVISHEHMKARIMDFLAGVLHVMRRLGTWLIFRKRKRGERVLGLVRFKDFLKNARFILYTSPIDFLLEQINDIIDALQYEWTYTKNFWKDPDLELTRYYKRKEEAGDGVVNALTTTSEVGVAESEPLVVDLQDINGNKAVEGDLREGEGAEMGLDIV